MDLQLGELGDLIATPQCVGEERGARQGSREGVTLKLNLLSHSLFPLPRLFRLVHLLIHSFTYSFRKDFL